MKQVSAGLLMYQLKSNSLEIFLSHPGGPFFKNKDAGYWTIPKGLAEPGEELLKAAIREFTEETGIKPEGPFHHLGSVIQKGGKEVHAWAFAFTEKSMPVLVSNMFQMEWPPKSGKMATFPEIDKSEFFPLDKAFHKINMAQAAFIKTLAEILKIPLP